MAVIRYRLLISEGGEYKAQKRVLRSHTDAFGTAIYEPTWEDMEGVDLRDCDSKMVAEARLRAAIRNIPKGHSPVSEFDEDGGRA